MSATHSEIHQKNKMDEWREGLVSGQTCDKGDIVRSLIVESR